MAGVNLSEESECILATNSELIGTVIRSCADEPFLSSEALQKKILNIGENKAHVTNVCVDIMLYSCILYQPTSDF